MSERSTHATAIIDAPNGDYAVYCLSGCGQVASVPYVGQARALRGMHSGKAQSEPIATVFDRVKLRQLLAS